MQLQVSEHLLDPHTEDEEQVWVLAKVIDVAEGIVEIPGAKQVDDDGEA